MRVFTPEDFNLPIPQQFERPGNSRQTPQMVIPPMGVPSGGGLASSDYPAGGGIAGGIGGNAGGVDSLYGFQFPNNGSMDGKEYKFLNDFIGYLKQPETVAPNFSGPPDATVPPNFSGPSNDQYSGTPSAPSKIGTNSYQEDGQWWAAPGQPQSQPAYYNPINTQQSGKQTTVTGQEDGKIWSTGPVNYGASKYDENGAVIPQAATQPGYGGYDTRIDPSYYSAGLSSPAKYADANGTINTYPSWQVPPNSGIGGWLSTQWDRLTASPESFTAGNGLQGLINAILPQGASQIAGYGAGKVLSAPSTGNMLLDRFTTPLGQSNVYAPMGSGVYKDPGATGVDWSGGDPGVMAGLDKVYGQKSVYDPNGTGWQTAPLTLNPTNPGYQLYGANDWESQYAAPSFGQAPAPAPSWSDLNGPAWGFNADASGYGGRYVNNPTYSAPQYNPSGNSLESPGWLEQMWGPMSRFVSGDANNTD